MDILLVHPYYISSTGLYQAKQANLNAPSAERIVADTFGYLTPQLFTFTSSQELTRWVLGVYHKRK